MIQFWNCFGLSSFDGKEYKNIIEEILFFPLSISPQKYFSSLRKASALWITALNAWSYAFYLLYFKLRYLLVFII